jgi:GTPase
MSEPQRAAVIAVIGAPNAGKSTLVNRIVGEKVAIVTHKAQTTRFPLRGVAMRDATQLVLVDTPGLFAPRRRLDRAMVASAWSALRDADAVVHVADAERLAQSAQALDEAGEVPTRLRDRAATAFLALNKIDAMARERLLPIAQRLHESGAYAQVFMISAAKGDGVDDLVSALVGLAPEGPWLFDADQAADAPAQLRAVEITREKLMLRLHEEIPYALTVETESWARASRGSVRISQIIYVARESHRRMVIGKGGAVLKGVGEAARKDIGRMLGVTVHLFLHVKLRENWSDERARYEAIGLDFDS